jgi:hypothetical protein
MSVCVSKFPDQLQIGLEKAMEYTDFPKIKKQTHQGNSWKSVYCVANSMLLLHFSKLNICGKCLKCAEQNFLNVQVRRNENRFLDDFLISVDESEFKECTSQFVTSNSPDDVRLTSRGTHIHES